MSAAAAELQLRDAVPGEEAAMAAVLDAAWRAAYGELIDPAVTAGTSVSEWEAALAKPGPDGTRNVVAISPAEPISPAERLADGPSNPGPLDLSDRGEWVVGFTRFGPDPEDPAGNVGYIASVYVDPHAAGRGVGRALVEYAVDALGDAGLTTVTLWVFRDNPRARALYERCGFVADGAELIDPRWGVPQVRYRRVAGAAR